MSRVWIIALTVCAVWSASVVAHAAAAKRRTEIHLITMGPGEQLFTRAGHLSLMVATLEGDQPVATKVYNYGDTDWDDPWLVPNFFRGKLDFFLSVSGTLAETVELYGFKQGRSIYRRKINLTDRQAEQLARELEIELQPVNRSYRYHHIEQICTTRVRDRLDTIVGGAVRKQLRSKLSEKTIHDDVAWAFSGHSHAAIAADLFFGRAHHRPQGLYDSLYEPARLSRTLETVRVPDPAGGKPWVPLVAARIAVVERLGPPLITRPSRASTIFAAAVALLLLALGVDARRRLAKSTRYAGAFLGVAGLIFGVVGLVIVLLWTLSGVPEFGRNEFALAFPASDLLLLGPARDWWRERRALPTWLPRYAQLRLGVAAVAVVLTLAGVFVQKPMAFPLLSFAFSVGLLLLLRSEHWRPGDVTPVASDAASG
jgi:hypothetical protein